MLMMRNIRNMKEEKKNQVKTVFEVENIRDRIIGWSKRMAQFTGRLTCKTQTMRGQFYNLHILRINYLNLPILYAKDTSKTCQ